MEGRVYLCTWKRVGRKYRLWVKGRPALVGEGTTFTAAREALWGMVCTQLGDGEAVLEFDPPEPQAGRVARLLDPPILTVTGNTRSELVGPPDALFQGGVCSLCGLPRGSRTDVPLTVDSIESGYEGGFVARVLLVFFSEQFLSLLTDDERKRYQWRPVQRQRRAKRTFYELIGEPGVSYVAMRGLPYRPLLNCDVCGRVSQPVYWGAGGRDEDLRNAGISTFVSRARLPHPLPSTFLLGEPGHYDLAMPQERWLELKRQRGARGLVGSPVGVLDPGEVKADLRVVKRAKVEHDARRNMQAFLQQIFRESDAPRAPRKKRR